MQEIKCPKCGEVFQVDESGYAAIVKQIRDKEFQKEVLEREAQYKARLEAIKNEAVAVKEKEITALQARLASYEMEKRLAVSEVVFKTERQLAEKNQELLKLTSKVEASEKESKIREQSIKDGYEEKLKLALKAEKAYYEDDKPIMTDSAYDSLTRELKAYED